MINFPLAGPELLMSYSSYFFREINKKLSIVNSSIPENVRKKLTKNNLTIDEKPVKASIFAAASIDLIYDTLMTRLVVYNRLM